MMGRCPKCSQLIDAAAKSCGNCAPTARHDDVEVEATCKLILEALDGKPEIDSELVKLVKAYEARGKRIAKLRNGLREAIAKSETDPKLFLGQALKALVEET